MRWSQRKPTTQCSSEACRCTHEERVLLQTTLTEHIVARVHGSVIHTHLTADSIELVEDGVDEALLTQSLVPFHVSIVRFAIIGFVVSIKKRV